MKNDKKEGIYVKELYLEVCAELHDGGEISHNEFSCLQNIDLNFKHTFFDDDGYSVSECIPYVVCFSRKKDDDKLYERYGKSDGCTDGACFSFNGGLLSSLNNSSEHGLFFFSYKVMYDREYVKNVIKENIIFTKKCFSDIN